MRSRKPGRVVGDLIAKQRRIKKRADRYSLYAWLLVLPTILQLVWFLDSMEDGRLWLIAIQGLVFVSLLYVIVRCFKMSSRLKRLYKDPAALSKQAHEESGPGPIRSIFPFV